jgi:hypothetical protein
MLNATDPDTFWDTTATVAVSIAAFTQGMLFMTGLYFIMEYAKKNKAELEAMPLDEEVKAYETKARHQSALHAHVTEWRKLPCWLKVTMVTGAMCMGLAAYAIGFFADLCFLPYDLTNSIECDLGVGRGGSILNIVTPDGWNAMALLAMSVVCLQVYSCWAGRQRTALSPEQRQAVLARTDKSWKATHTRLSAHPFLMDEAPHASWRENSKMASDGSTSTLQIHTSGSDTGVVV